MSRQPSVTVPATVAISGSFTFFPFFLLESQFGREPCRCVGDAVGLYGYAYAGDFGADERRIVKTYGHIAGLGLGVAVPLRGGSGIVVCVIQAIGGGRCDTQRHSGRNYQSSHISVLEMDSASPRREARRSRRSEQDFYFTITLRTEPSE